MIVLGEYVIYLSTYFTIGMIISVVFSIVYMIQDWKNRDEYDPFLFTALNDIGEGFCIGLGWIVSIPVLIVISIIKAILVIISWLIPD